MRQTAEVLGIIGLFTFAFSSLLSTSGASIGLSLLVLATVLQPPTLQNFRRDPVVVLAVVSFFYLVIRTLWAIWEIPETAHLQITQAWGWLRLWLLMVVAWWIKGSVRRSDRVLLLCLLGFLTGIAIYLVTHGDVLGGGQRTGFHLKIIAFGLYSSTAILGLSVLAPRAWGEKPHLLPFILRVVLWFIALALLVQALIMTQSRGAWLTAILVIPPITILRYRGVGRSGRLRIGLVSAVLLGCAILVAMNFRTLATRLAQEKEIFAATWRGDLNAVPTFGFGVRVHTFRFGAAKWLERPLFGWGPGSTEYLISHSGLPQLRHSKLIEGGWKEGPEWLDHLHNTYLEVLVRFGLVGAFLMLGSLGLLVKGIYVARRGGRLPPDHFWFLNGALGLMAVWSLSDFRLLHPDWRSYWIVIGGIMGTFWMPRGLPGSPPDDTSTPRHRKAEDTGRGL